MHDNNVHKQWELSRGYQHDGGQAVDLTQERGPDPERAPGHGLSSISAGQKCLNAQCGSLSKVQTPWCRSVSVKEASDQGRPDRTASGQINNNKDYGIVRPEDNAIDDSLVARFVRIIEQWTFVHKDVGKMDLRFEEETWFDRTFVHG